ncbi:MAG: T9SS type A sorting domain-containing protein, partial [Bacteroidota bacterium]
PAVYEFDYGDNARLPQSRVLSYYQDLSNDGLPDYSTVWLGNTVAYDSENPANNAADGDTDDGFSLNTRINEGMLYPQIGLNSNFETTCYYLFGIDWDDDGQFDHIETGSQQLNGAASLNIDLAVPQGFITGDVNIRILVSEESLSEADITGDVVAMGEVEDYRMKITSDEDCSNGIDDDGDGLTDCDDPDCSGIESCPVTPTGPGGGEGGLESNDRLSDKIAKVRFERTKSRAIDYNDKSILPILEKNSDYGKKIANRLAEGFGIEQFIPIDVLANSETYITSPIHLTDITNATEVFSADVFEGDNRVAAILALTSENGVYEHTKYVCDRLGGSVIEDVLTYKLDEEHDFQIAKMRLPSGNLEYATSFSASELDGAFAIESHWNLDYYTKEKSFYNFQIWSNTVQNLADLANETIRLLNVQMPVNSYDFGEAPEFFVNEASISSGILNLKTTNKGSYLNVEANGFYRNTETADRELFNESIQLNGEEKEEISVDLTGIYDLGLTFYHEKAAMPDVIFMADGAWGTDYDEATETIAEYKVSPGFTEGEEVYSLERDIRISGQVQESVAIFRSLDAVWRSKDVSAYNSLSFTASGAGRMEVTLVKSSISEWSEQPRVTIDLTDEKLSYQLSQAEFNGASGEEIKWNDIISVVFDIKGNGTSKEHFELELSNVAFRNQTVTNVWEEEATAVKVFPNPATDYLNLTFTSNHSGTYVISILDQSGKVVKSVFGHTNRGTQSVNIDDLPDQKGLYIYKIKLANKELATGKILIE